MKELTTQGQHLVFVGGFCSAAESELAITGQISPPLQHLKRPLTIGYSLDRGDLHEIVSCQAESNPYLGG